MSNPSRLGAIEYEPETAFGEDLDTFRWPRLPHRGMVDASGLKHDKVEAERVVQYRNDGSQWVLMTQGGSFKTLLDLTGHGTSTEGTPELEPIEQFLGYVFGNVGLSATASTTATGGAAFSVQTEASGTFTRGGLAVVGKLGDGRGNGQMYPVSSHAAKSIYLLTAMDGTPAAGDVVYPVAQIFTSELPSAAGLTGAAHPTPAPGLRFRLLTANLCYECHGCYPTAVALSGLQTRGRPQIEITWAVSWWRYSTAAFPSTAAMRAFNPAAVAAGSIVLNDYNYQQRVKRAARDFKIDYTLGMVALEGPGGVSPYQTCVGCRRTADKIKVSWTEDADGSTLTPTLPGLGTSQTYQHLMATLSTAAGSRVGFYFRHLAITNVATQRDDNGINRLTVEAEAHVSPAGTDDLSLSAFCMGFA